MRVVVDVLLNLECRTFLLHFETEYDVEVHVLVCSLLVVLATLIVFGVVGILDEVARMFPIAVVDTETEELLVDVVLHEVLTCEVDHRTCVACLIYYK